MSVAIQCVISWAVGVMAGVLIVVVGLALTGWEFVRVEPGRSFALITGDLAIVRRSSKS